MADAPPNSIRDYDNRIHEIDDGLLATISLSEYIKEALLYPSEVASILHQIGYRPGIANQNDINCDNPVSKFQYVFEIFSTEGLRGLSRGIIPFLAGHVIQDLSATIVNRDVPHLLAAHMADYNTGDDIEDNLNARLSLMFVRQFIGVILSHPFHLLATRQAVQYIGKETSYSLPMGLLNVYVENGICGYFYGFLTRFASELILNSLIETADYCYRNFAREHGVGTSNEYEIVIKYGEFCASLVRRTARIIASALIGYMDQATTNLEISQSGLAAENQPCKREYLSWITKRINLCKSTKSTGTDNTQST